MEVTLFLHPSSTSSNKAKKWLDGRNIKYKVRHTLRQPPTTIELKQILKASRKNGIEAIVSTRSKDYKEREKLYDEMKLDEFLNELHQNPKLIKVPLIVAGDNLISGYDPKALEMNFK